MKMLTFANRNAKEILRDPLTLFFGLGFPLVLILLLSVIQANIPVSLFEIAREVGVLQGELFGGCHHARIGDKIINAHAVRHITHEDRGEAIR